MAMVVDVVKAMILAVGGARLRPLIKVLLPAHRVPLIKHILISMLRQETPRILVKGIVQSLTIISF